MSNFNKEYKAKFKELSKELGGHTHLISLEPECLFVCQNNCPYFTESIIEKQCAHGIDQKCKSSSRRKDIIKMWKLDCTVGM